MPIAVTMKIQPMEFRGRLEMIRAPTRRTGEGKKQHGVGDDRARPLSEIRMQIEHDEDESERRDGQVDHEQRNGDAPAVRSCIWPPPSRFCLVRGVEESWSPAPRFEITDTPSCR
jgi:hypothetical protein